MKSRTSFFDKTAFRKDVTRFAPAWGLYSVGLLTVLLAIFIDDPSPYRLAETIVELFSVTALANLCYAFLNAQLLFGDLFNSRLCNSLHAMPLRRETWFGSHVAAGISFSLVPNLGAVLVAYALLQFEAGWPVMLWWLLAATLQYICFFGIAVFAMMLSGNRLAAAMVYGIVNFLSLMIYWLLDSLYEPLLLGLRFRVEPFSYFSPMVWMAEAHDMLSILAERIEDPNSGFVEWLIQGVKADPQAWLLLAVYALVGLVLMGLSLVMYKKRNLECAGDFTAIKAAEPVLHIVYTVTAGAVLHLFGNATGMGFLPFLLLVIGLTIGWFTGLMLLQRTTRVFRIRSVLAFAAFAGVFLLTLVATWLDPLGITRWVPEPEKVVSVNLSTRYDHHYYSQGELEITDPEQIRDMLDIHSYAIDYSRGKYFQEPGYIFNVNVCLEYTLEDGSTRSRFYEIPTDSEMGQLLKMYYSSFEYVTGYTEDQIPELAANMVRINAGGTRDSEEYQDAIKNMGAEEMLRSIAADCAAGNMAQESAYHFEEDAEGGWDWGDRTYLEFCVRLADPAGRAEQVFIDDASSLFYTYITVYDNCENTLNWMAENGLYDPNAPIG